jgi:hypothetical protein
LAFHLHINGDPDPGCHNVADPVQDPTFQIDADPCGSRCGSATLYLNLILMANLKKVGCCGSGSESFDHQAKTVRKTLILLFCDVFMTFYL